MKGKQLSRMLVLATQRHEGQFDKGGASYVLHCLKVMHYVRTEDEELQCIALGHDLIEDTFASVNDGMVFLRYHGFSERVISGIVALTKVMGEPYEEYKSRVKANRDAVLVKMADLRHNSDIRRLKGATPKDFARMAKYHEFYLELEAIRCPATPVADDTFSGTAAVMQQAGNLARANLDSDKAKAQPTGELPGVPTF